MNRMRRAIKNMKVGDMNTGMTIIIVGDLLVEADSLEVETMDHDDQLNVSHVITKVTDTQTDRIKTIPN